MQIFFLRGQKTYYDGHYSRYIQLYFHAMKIIYFTRVCLRIFELSGQKAFHDRHPHIIVDKYVQMYFNDKTFYILQDFLYGPLFLSYIL